jgi:hypothetical protein
MKWLLILLFVSASAFSDTAWYMDEDRSGEGIVVSELQGNRLAFAFYSHTAVVTGEPTVSPPPPFPIYCDLDTVWFTGLSEVYWLGIARGDLMYEVAVATFPLSEGGFVSQSVVVGDFTIWQSGDGFILRMETNYVMCDLSVFGVNHYFETKIAE